MSDTDEFILFPDPRLSEKAEPQPVEASLVSIGARLLAAAQRVNAYGLAAVHIGEVAPVVVVSVGPADQRDYRLFYNPRVASTEGAQEQGKEGSVSMPGIEVEVLRASTALIGFDDERGHPQQLELTGFAARVVQHEIDQVNGVFFLDRLSRLKREAAMRRFAKLGRRAG
jgi:peptide deformylase